MSIFRAAAGTGVPREEWLPLSLGQPSHCAQASLPLLREPQCLAQPRSQPTQGTVQRTRPRTVSAAPVLASSKALQPSTSQQAVAAPGVMAL